MYELPHELPMCPHKKKKNIFAAGAFSPLGEALVLTQEKKDFGSFTAGRASMSTHKKRFRILRNKEISRKSQKSLKLMAKLGTQKTNFDSFSRKIQKICYKTFLRNT